MAYKVPGLIRTAVDPLGLGVSDALFGAQKGPSYDQQEAAKAKALADNQQATGNFVDGGQANYTSGEQLQNARQGDTSFDNINTDPAYKAQQLRSLQDLQDQSQNGFNASDRADMAKTRAAVDTANRGRVGAIMQRSQAQGQGGGGLDLVAQLQSAQDANSTEALRALETEANAEQRKTAASAAAGGLSTSLQNQDFNQQAARAAAQDRINQFNTQNSNNANEYNVNRFNTTGDRNATAGYDYRRDVLGARQGQNAMNYNAATDSENQGRIDNAAAEQRAAGRFGALAGAGGAVIGGVYGGPQGAATGAQVGSGLGSSVGSNNYRNQHYWQGGKVPGKAPHPGDDPRNDVVGALVAPGEVVVPRSMAGDPAKAAAFVAKANQKPAPAAPNAHDNADDDAIGHLIKAMHAMHKGRK